MNEQPNENALAAYIAHIADIATIAARLVEYADDHGGVDPDDINWTHVSDLTEVVKALRGAASWAGIDLEAEAAQEEAEWHYMMDTQYDDADVDAADEDPMLLKL